VLAEERVGPLDRLLADLGDILVVRERAVVRRRSRDFFWYSPILNAKLSGKSADVLVQPRDEADVVRIAAACARYRVPLTPRGGGTGNYGQAMPLHGGVLLDMTALDRIEWVSPGRPGREDARPRRGAAAVRLRAADASFDQAHRDDRGLRRGRLRRRRLRDLGRPARARQHRRRPDRDAGGAARPGAARRGCVARIGGMGAWTPTPSRVRRCGHRSGVPAPAYG
jgi:hypothetical protein